MAWETEKSRAFLTPFPSTAGVTVVIPTTNSDDNVSSQTDGHFHNAVQASPDPKTTGDKA